MSADPVESSDEAVEADPVDANPQDLALAVKAIGAKARYGGLLSCALAGIYAERERNAAVRAEAVADQGDPVAWAVRTPDGVVYVPGDTPIQAGTRKQAEKVAAWNDGRGGAWSVVPLFAVPVLVATPPSA